jgi:hypothetical protein
LADFPNGVAPEDAIESALAAPRQSDGDAAIVGVAPRVRRRPDALKGD